MQTAHRTVLRAFLIPAVLVGSVAIAQTSNKTTAKTSQSASARADSVAADTLIQPNELAGRVVGPAAHRPVLVHVGFDALYKGGHIPGSVYAGPTSEPEGIAALKKTLKPMSRQKEIVLYCGCCPWEDCPNVRAALAAARSMGFKHVRTLYIPRSFQQDWVDKGLPTTKGGT